MAALVAAVAADGNAARAAAGQDWPPFVLVIGLLLVGLVANDDGLLAAVGGVLARTARSGLLLYAGSVVLIAVGPIRLTVGPVTGLSAVWCRRA